MSAEDIAQTEIKEIVKQIWGDQGSDEQGAAKEVNEILTTVEQQL